MTSTASITMLVTPEETVTHSPSMGFSAVIMKDWNNNCKTPKGSAARIILEYSTASWSICPSAPKASATGGAINIPMTVNIMPKAAQT